MIINHLSDADDLALLCSSQRDLQELLKKYLYRLVKKTVFELLDTIDIHVPETDRYDPFFVVYD